MNPENKITTSSTPEKATENLPLCIYPSSLLVGLFDFYEGIMAKRLTATEKWEDSWFRKLDSKNKLLWIYMLDRCDIAGFWEKDFELAGYFIGCKYNESEVLEKFKSRVVSINSKLFIPKFIEFQYNRKFTELDENNTVHKAVIKILKKYPSDSLSIPYIDPIDGSKDKDKNKDKVLVKDKEKYADNVKMTSQEHLKLIGTYGKEQTEKMIEILNNYKNSSGKKYKSDYATILSWVVERYNKDNNGTKKHSSKRGGISDFSGDKPGITVS
jgi:hypothetical protein